MIHVTDPVLGQREPSIGQALNVATLRPWTTQSVIPIEVFGINCSKLLLFKVTYLDFISFLMRDKTEHFLATSTWMAWKHASI